MIITVDVVLLTKATISSFNSTYYNYCVFVKYDNIYMINKQFAPNNTRHPKARWQWFCRNIRMRRLRSSLKNERFSIICNNCLGAMIVHDFLQPHLSPTVNLYFEADDFIRFISNLKDNLQAEVCEEQSDFSYPVGSVNGCKLYFQHYENFQTAKETWTRRANRVMWENLLIVFVEREGCTYEHLKLFNALPFPNKIALVHKNYPEINTAILVPGYEDEREVGIITGWANWFGRRKYDIIDWVSILNNMI